ncbi:MAG: putative lipid II flippase FtsW [Kiritimatiellae bacterium]|nr:putative lipid II flippase FtsW [Kiritimatiellia bacterium]
MRKSVLFALGLVVACIVTLGLVVLSSAGQANGVRLHHDAFFFFKRQLIFVAAGIPLAYFISRFDYHHLRDNMSLTFFAYAALIALLILALCFPPINGSRRWIPMKIINLQPSEIAKIMSVIIVAMWTDRLKWKIDRFVKGAVIPTLLMGVMAALVMLEPDFGSTMVIALAAFLTMFLAGTKLLHLVAMASMAAPMFIYKIVRNANRMARIAAYMGRDTAIGGADVSSTAIDNAAYQGHHALVSLHNGGIWGVGLNESMQKHSFLPEMHTDMIFAIGAEELGLIFSLVVVALWVAFFVLSLYIAYHATDHFGKLIAVGMAFVLFFQTFFNIGVVCGALPMKGMALPFFTYGGTNILCAFAAVGLILSVGNYAAAEYERKHRRG